MLLLSLSFAQAEVAPWTPLRVALDCQSSERVDACTLVKGTLQGLKVVVLVPRSESQVVLFLNATSAANDDYVQLRAVSDTTAGVTGAPASFEQTAAVDYRLSVDEQRAILDATLNRALGPYVTLAVPGAVTVSLAAPDGGAASEETTPWGFSVWGGGFGSWSQDYQNLSLWSGLSISRTTNTELFDTWLNYSRSIELQPSLVVDSETVALTSDSSSVVGSSTVAHNLNDHWTIGGNIRGGHEDPEGQYLATGRADVGVEYNLFPSDDPRGNRLAVGWFAGVQSDWYNAPNTLGEEHATFPAQLLLGSAEVRVDTVSLSLALSAESQIFPFAQRYILGASVEADITVGDHLDVSFAGSATQQAIPGPANIDASSYEAVTRASYAQPLQMDGYTKIRVHWDNTNSARNNRFTTIADVDVTDGL